MLTGMTLRNRIFLFSSFVVLLALALMWVFVRPQYKEAIINERTTIISQLQEYSLNRTDQTIRNWLSSINYLADEISRKPDQTQDLARSTINLTPGLTRIQITEESSPESFDIRRSLYDSYDFTDIRFEWYPSRLDQKINIGWSVESSQNMRILVAQKAIQIGENIFSLEMFFNASPIINELTSIPLGGNYTANIIDENGENLISGPALELPSFLIDDDGYSNITQTEFNGTNWFVLTSRFQTVPFWHVIAAESSFVLQPFIDLINYSIIVGVIILLTLFSLSWYVSIRVNKPVEQIITDVEYMSALNFDHQINSVSLPEFSLMQKTLENIRVTLNHYQKINVEKIILEEWKNRYMMTYSEDLIGILDESKKFSFLNNNFERFLENLSIDPDFASLDDILKHSDITTGKFEQTTHHPDPYTIKINSSEVSHFLNNEKSDFYDLQYISIVDQEEKEQATLIIMHDKTEDRLNEIKRNDMINIIVHELKNPITGVLGLSDILIEEVDIDRKEQLVLLNEINLSGERMNTLVNRFLDIQRLESGRTSIDFEEVNFIKVVENVCSISHPHLSRKNLKTTIIKEGTNFSVRANNDFAFDAIQNLLSNAIKYGGENRNIELELRETDSSLKVSVTDFGYGISLEDQKKVFDKFYRIKATAREQGTGLGLAYVREIMHRHNGEIELKSNEEIGSRFTLVFPKNKPEKTT